MSANKYYEHYERNGFNFDKATLTRYAISLYTKPFVILSGISGTGKTKIAQLFQVFEDAPAVTQIESNSGKYIILKIKDGALNGDGRGNLKFSDLEAVFEPEETPVIGRRIKQLRDVNREDNITEPEPFTIVTKDGEIPISIYLQRASSPLLRVRFKSKKGETPGYNSQIFLKDNYKIDDVLKLEKVGRRKLKIVTVNEEPISILNDKLERIDDDVVNNKLFIAVKSNWNDSTELFGFYNTLDERYYLTPFLKFLLTANEHPEKPFFLILDEMNLSRVEHYFSDYLSCLESRVMIDGKLHQESIQLHNFPSFIDSTDNYFDEIPNKIEIPSNLYVTGTVNIDETTFTFSPKVLDRANVIEFNEVFLSAYSKQKDEDNTYVLKTFPQFGKVDLANSSHLITTPAKFQEILNKLLSVLQPYNLHFGYRVINEMSLYILNSISFVGGEEIDIKAAIDYQISQKVLTKLNGAFGKLDEPVRKLIALLLEKEEIDFLKIDLDMIATINFKETKFPESIKKLCQLYKNLVYNGFASFLE